MLSIFAVAKVKFDFTTLLPEPCSFTKRTEIKTLTTRFDKFILIQKVDKFLDHFPRIQVIDILMAHRSNQT